MRLISGKNPSDQKSEAGSSAAQRPRSDGVSWVREQLPQAF